MVQKISIVGIDFDCVTVTHACEKVREFLSSNKQYKIFTPNPEFVVKAQKDEYFMYSLNQGDLNICDGRGIQLVSKEKIERIAGVDFMLEICEIAHREGRSVFLLGSGSDAVVQKTADSLQKKFPGLKIVGFDKGPLIEEVRSEKTEPKLTSTPFLKEISYKIPLHIDEAENGRLIEKINKQCPDILFVAFGMGKQEKWICENIAKLPSVKIAMGVGGAFDFISGTVKRAPLLLRKSGLEWLYRLIQQPKRILRIWNATAVFLWLVYKSKFKN